MKIEILKKLDNMTLFYTVKSTLPRSVPYSFTEFHTVYSRMAGFRDLHETLVDNMNMFAGMGDVKMYIKFRHTYDDQFSMLLGTIGVYEN